MNWIILVSGIVFNATASILMKFAAVQPTATSFEFSLAWICRQWPLFLGVGFYGLAFILYYLALNRIPLSIAHPLLTAGAIIIVNIASVVLFHEPLTVAKTAGIALIVVGVVVLSFSK